jgi:uncharacterized protein
MVRFLLAGLFAMLLFGSAQAADDPALGALQRAAEKGAATAQLELASHYMMGRGIAQDPKIARVWYEKAANQGNLKAQTILGLLYANGTGVKPDAAMAAKWLKRAALQGAPTAQLTLGAIFAEGKGVPQDYIQSHIWFSLAASKLPPGTARRVALQLRQGVSRKMSSEQIDEATTQAQGLRSYEKGLGK